jgi:flagellar hook protein FlgE
MSLYGALFSGVSGLTAQSSAMGAISDNITNVSTVGYKNTVTNFQTLVTKQTSSTFYSAGGVQSRPRQQTDVQGLLQASTSQTDISISGRGFFVVNEVNTPTVSNEFLFTRAGSFIQDDEGYLKNAAGFYLQGWPTNASGVVVPANDSLTIANQNIISTDYLETVNLNRVGGTASATGTIAIGANLPSSDTVGTTHKTDVQFFDSLGNAQTMSVVYTKGSVANQWDIGIEPPSGTAVITQYDSTGAVYDSVGQLEFLARPMDGATVVIAGTTYEFDPANDGIGAGTEVDTSSNTTVAQDVAALVAAVIATDANFTTANARIAVKAGNTSTVVFNNDTVGSIVVSGLDSLNSAATVRATNQGIATTTFTVPVKTNTNAGLIFDSGGLPSSFNVAKLEILNYTNGSANMNDGASEGKRITLDLGTVSEANGMTQYGDSFTPVFITQDGSKFGTFAGVTIGTDGLMTALFDNGETRKIYKLPMATFVNPNSLEGRTGNIWNATEASGDYTLREADNGPAGQVTQGALEASTVDIGAEFTSMIVVQRAYSASTKIISTADEMLEELMRTKR